ncbi:MAG: hypothetical protein HQK65_15305 [Desulfamplus sp.]|nr:hypothetical protein [Desulfamplus sp.]
MDTEFVLNSSLLFLKYIKDEWNIFVPDVPPLEMTPAQIKLYKDIKTNVANRSTKVLQLVELQKRLDILLLHEDRPEFKKAIIAFQKAIKQIRQS